MEIKEIINICCTILSAIFAGASFKFYKKSVNIYGNNTKKTYKNVNQNNGDNGVNIVGDNNKL